MAAIARVKGAIREISGRLRTARASLPALEGRMDLVGRWILGARRAQIALAASLFALLVVFPPIRDAVLEAIFPSVTSRGGFLGLSRRRQANPSFETAQTIVTVLAWTAAGGTVGALLLLQLPMVVAADRSRSRAASGVGVDPAALGSAHTVHAASRASGAPGTIARYRLDAELGRGAMGVVYRAHDEVLDRDVALKELPAALAAEPALVERFRTEARALARLAHPNIVQVYDLVEDGNRLFMAMELVEGGDLAGVVAARERLPAPEALRLARLLAEAMAYAHERGVLHRDFKPQNVLMTADGAPKISDFGLAKLAQGPKLTQAGAVMGTPAYMSPEQAGGREVDARGDVYALGVTMYEMLTGRVPFEGDFVTILAAHIMRSPPPLREVAPDVPEAVERLVLEMLAKDPAARVSDMTTVAGRIAVI